MKQLDYIVAAMLH